MLNQMVIDKFVGCDTIVSRYNFNVDGTSDADIEYQSTKSGSVQSPTRFKVNRYWSGREDLNLRPLEPHSSALPDCATPRRSFRITPSHGNVNT